MTIGDMTKDIFEGRLESFRFGYAAFHNGDLNNFYSEVTDFAKNREWQAGFDAAYTECQQWWMNGGKIT